MTAYKLMKKAIERGSQSKEELTKKANTFYMAGQLTEAEYNELIGLINNTQAQPTAL